MHIEDLIAPKDVFVDVQADDKRQLLTLLARKAALLAGIDERVVMDGLLKREDLGSTGMGEGAAIPHARLPGVDKPVGLFARLKRPIPFQAIDDKPVDLVCLLLLPTAGQGSEPLSALACVARRLRTYDVLVQMRRAAGPTALYGLLVSPLAAA
jgi:nitrogen PTS system EIIA component